MKSASQMLFDVAGCPAVDGANSSQRVLDVDLPECRCWLCGAPTADGVPWKKWQSAKFTDQNKCSAPESDCVCPACVWACSWVRPLGYPAPEAGKRGVNLRLFSHLLDARGYQYFNKAAKPSILSWLRGPHEGDWLACIADSGQKHLIPWTPINPPGLQPGYGVVYFEQRQLQLGNWALVDAMVELLTLGTTKAEVETGSYSARSWGVVRNELRRFESSFASLRGGAWFSLALWLSQRNEARWKVIDAERKERKRNGGNAQAAD